MDSIIMKHLISDGTVNGVCDVPAVVSKEERNGGARFT